MLCYGCGLRLSELVHVKVKHIDGKRKTVFIENGKGNKHRYVVISNSVPQQLRVYWQEYRPKEWLFYSMWLETLPMAGSSYAKALKKVAVIQKQQGLAPIKLAAEPAVINDLGWPCTECKVGRLTLAAIILPTFATANFINST